MSEASAIFRALADDTRRDILRLLSVSRRPVGELAASFPGISRPAVSKHLRILRQTGLVSESRDGRRRLYRLERRALAAVAGWLAAIETGVGEVAATEAAAAPRRRERVAVRPRAGVRPLRRDEPEDADWRAW